MRTTSELRAQNRASRWWLSGLALTFIVALVAAALVLRQQGASLALTAPSPSPLAVPSRSALFPAPVVAAPVPTSAGLQRALAVALRDPALGSRVALSVLDTAGGEPLLELGATRPVTPASTAKIATAVAVLTVLPPDQRFQTRVLQGPRGDIVLVGGGDPTLAGSNATPNSYPEPARLADLATQLKGVVVRRVLVDDSLFTGPPLGPGWKPNYVQDGDVAPIGALAVDRGELSTKDRQPRSADPGLEAGRQLAALLQVKSAGRGTAPAGAALLATVSSPPVAELVESMLVASDNDLAEALGRQLALASGQPASFVGAVAAIAAALGPLLDQANVHRSALALQDASGLSPLSRLQPVVITRLLALVGREARYAPILSGLPVAGFDGTLANRYRSAPTSSAAGVVRAKTGTLNGVSALAGLVRTRDGRLLAFDATADGVPIGSTLAAQAALDRVATALAACGCR